MVNEPNQPHPLDSLDQAARKQIEQRKKLFRLYLVLLVIPVVAVIAVLALNPSLAKRVAGTLGDNPTLAASVAGDTRLVANVGTKLAKSLAESPTLSPTLSSSVAEGLGKNPEFVKQASRNLSVQLQEDPEFLPQLTARIASEENFKVLGWSKLGTQFLTSMTGDPRFRGALRTALQDILASDKDLVLLVARNPELVERLAVAIAADSTLTSALSKSVVRVLAEDDTFMAGIVSKLTADKAFEDRLATELTGSTVFLEVVAREIEKRIPPPACEFYAYVPELKEETIGEAGLRMSIGQARGNTARDVVIFNATDGPVWRGNLELDRPATFTVAATRYSIELMFLSTRAFHRTIAAFRISRCGG